MKKDTNARERWITMIDLAESRSGLDFVRHRMTRMGMMTPEMEKRIATREQEIIEEDKRIHALFR